MKKQKLILGFFSECEYTKFARELHLNQTRSTITVKDLINGLKTFHLLRNS